LHLVGVGVDAIGRSNAPDVTCVRTGWTRRTLGRAGPHVRWGRAGRDVPWDGLDVNLRLSADHVQCVRAKVTCSAFERRSRAVRSSEGHVQCVRAKIACRPVSGPSRPRQPQPDARAQPVYEAGVLADQISIGASGHYPRKPGETGATLFERTPATPHTPDTTTKQNSQRHISVFFRWVSIPLRLQQIQITR